MISDAQHVAGFLLATLPISIALALVMVDAIHKDAGA